jgi:putative SOS response-associated peptidase YedK
MTVLYRLDASSAGIARAFGVRVGQDPWAGGYVAPGSFAPVVTAGREFVAGPKPAGAGRRLEARMVPRLWGVPPPGPMPPEPYRGVLTVRNPESPFWIGNLRNTEFRCLVPATSFMVWGKGKTREDKRVQHRFALSDQPLFAFAGIWKDSEVPSFALLMCEPNATLRAAGRDSMPVILPPDTAAHDVWLRGDWNRARALLAPYSSSQMTEHR